MATVSERIGAGRLGEQAAANRSAVRSSAAYWIAIRRAVAMLVVLMSAALWAVGAWQVVDGDTTLGAVCIFVGGGAFFVTVAWLRHGREGGERVRRVRHWVLDARAVAHRV